MRLVISAALWILCLVWLAASLGPAVAVAVEQRAGAIASATQAPTAPSASPAMADPRLFVVATASVVISLLALTVAAVTLWRTHLAGFRPIVVVSDLFLQTFRIKSGDRNWFIVSGDVTMSFTNSGARIGTVTGLRLSLHYPDVPIDKNREYLESRFDVKVDADLTSISRFKWPVGHWMPFVVLPKDTVVKRVRFERRWDHPVVQKHIECGLEMRVGGKQEWRRVAGWELSLADFYWNNFRDGSTGLVFPSSDRTWLDGEPPDLHKYVSSPDFKTGSDATAGPPTTMY